jgi:ATP-dependent Clp protease ATP-binding subunit ClpA
MSREMASQILDKKLMQLKERLKAKNVEMEVTLEAHDWMLRKGFTQEYGARELDRVITSQLKSLLMREILFGKLKKGGKTIVRTENDRLVLS